MHYPVTLEWKGSCHQAVNVVGNWNGRSLKRAPLSYNKTRRCFSVKVDVCFSGFMHFYFEVDGHKKLSSDYGIERNHHYNRIEVPVSKHLQPSRKAPKIPNQNTNFGHINSRKARVKFVWPNVLKNDVIELHGNWDNWKSVWLVDNKKGVTLSLPAGHYQFKFIINGIYTINENWHIRHDGFYENNYIEVTNDHVNASNPNSSWYGRKSSAKVFTVGEDINYDSTLQEDLFNKVFTNSKKSTKNQCLTFLKEISKFSKRNNFGSHIVEISGAIDAIRRQITDLELPLAVTIIYGFWNFRMAIASSSTAGSDFVSLVTELLSKATVGGDFQCSQDLLVGLCPIESLDRSGKKVSWKDLAFSVVYCCQNEHNPILENIAAYMCGSLVANGIKFWNRFSEIIALAPLMANDNASVLIDHLKSKSAALLSSIHGVLNKDSFVNLVESIGNLDMLDDLLPFYKNLLSKNAIKELKNCNEDLSTILSHRAKLVLKKLEEFDGDDWSTFRESLLPYKFSSPMGVADISGFNYLIKEIREMDNANPNKSILIAKLYRWLFSSDRFADKSEFLRPVVEMMKYDFGKNIQVGVLLARSTVEDSESDSPFMMFILEALENLNENYCDEVIQCINEGISHDLPVSREATAMLLDEDYCCDDLFKMLDSDMFTHEYCLRLIRTPYNDCTNLDDHLNEVMGLLSLMDFIFDVLEKSGDWIIPPRFTEISSEASWVEELYDMIISGLDDGNFENNWFEISLAFLKPIAKMIKVDSLENYPPLFWAAKLREMFEKYNLTPTNNDPRPILALLENGNDFMMFVKFHNEIITLFLHKYKDVPIVQEMKEIGKMIWQVIRVNLCVQKGDDCTLTMKEFSTWLTRADILRNINQNIQNPYDSDLELVNQAMHELREVLDRFAFDNYRQIRQFKHPLLEKLDDSRVVLSLKTFSCIPHLLDTSHIRHDVSQLFSIDLESNVIYLRPFPAGSITFGQWLQEMRSLTEFFKSIVSDNEIMNIIQTQCVTDNLLWKTLFKAHVKSISESNNIPIPMENEGYDQTSTITLEVLVKSMREMARFVKDLQKGELKVKDLTNRLGFGNMNVLSSAKVEMLSGMKELVNSNQQIRVVQYTCAFIEINLGIHQFSNDVLGSFGSNCDEMVKKIYKLHMDRSFVSKIKMADCEDILLKTFKIFGRHCGMQHLQLCCKLFDWLALFEGVFKSCNADTSNEEGNTIEKFEILLSSAKPIVDQSQHAKERELMDFICEDRTKAVFKMAASLRDGNPESFCKHLLSIPYESISQLVNGMQNLFENDTTLVNAMNRTNDATKTAVQAYDNFKDAGCYTLESDPQSGRYVLKLELPLVESQTDNRQFNGFPKIGIQIENWVSTLETAGVSEAESTLQSHIVYLDTMASLLTSTSQLGYRPVALNELKYRRKECNHIRLRNDLEKLEKSCNTYLSNIEGIFANHHLLTLFFPQDLLRLKEKLDIIASENQSEEVIEIEIKKIIQICSPIFTCDDEDLEIEVSRIVYYTAKLRAPIGSNGSVFDDIAAWLNTIEVQIRENFGKVTPLVLNDASNSVRKNESSGNVTCKTTALMYHLREQSKHSTNALEDAESELNDGDKLFGLMLNSMSEIYHNRMPHSLETFICEEVPGYEHIVTQKLKQFIRRMMYYTNLTYSIIHIERLNAAQQQELAEFLQENATTRVHMFNFGFSSSISISEALFVKVKIQKMMTQSDIWKQKLFNASAAFEEILFVTGRPACGKTHFIAKRHKMLTCGCTKSGNVLQLANGKPSEIEGHRMYHCEDCNKDYCEPCAIQEHQAQGHHINFLGVRTGYVRCISASNKYMERQYSEERRIEELTARTCACENCNIEPNATQSVYIPLHTKECIWQSSERLSEVSTTIEAPLINFNMTNGYETLKHKGSTSLSTVTEHLKYRHDFNIWLFNMFVCKNLSSTAFNSCSRFVPVDAKWKMCIELQYPCNDNNTSPPNHELLSKHYPLLRYADSNRNLQVLSTDISRKEWDAKQSVDDFPGIELDCKMLNRNKVVSIANDEFIDGLYPFEYDLKAHYVATFIKLRHTKNEYRSYLNSFQPYDLNSGRLTQICTNPPNSAQEGRRWLSLVKPVELTTKLQQSIWLNYLYDHLSMLENSSFFPHISEKDGLFDLVMMSAKLTTLSTLFKDVASSQSSNWSLYLDANYDFHIGIWGNQNILDAGNSAIVTLSGICVSIPRCKITVLRDDILCRAFDSRYNPHQDIYGFTSTINTVSQMFKDSGFVDADVFKKDLIWMKQRVDAKVPMIIAAETGRGKTFLINMLSKLCCLEMKRMLDRQLEGIVELCFPYGIVLSTSMQFHTHKLLVTALRCLFDSNVEDDIIDDSLLQNLHNDFKNQYDNASADAKTTLWTPLLSKCDEVIVFLHECALKYNIKSLGDDDTNDDDIESCNIGFCSDDSCEDDDDDNENDDANLLPNPPALMNPIETIEATDVDDENESVGLNELFNLSNSSAIQVKIEALHRLVNKEQIVQLLNRFDGTNEADYSIDKCVEFQKSVKNLGIRKVFYRLQVHSSHTVKDISDFIQKVINETSDIPKLDELLHQRSRVIVFLDEVNTCSCSGLIRELFENHTYNGIPLPDHIVITAAINLPPEVPFTNESRNKSKEDLEWENAKEADMSFGYHYNIRAIPKPLQSMIWNMDRLNPEQEKQFIAKRWEMFNNNLSPNQQFNESESTEMCGAIECCQRYVRDLGQREIIDHFILKHPGVEVPQRVIEAASKCAASRTSQRDINRVMNTLPFCMEITNELQRMRRNTAPTTDRRTFLFTLRLALALCYLLRLKHKQRGDLDALLAQYFMNICPKDRNNGNIIGLNYAIHLVKMKFIKQTIRLRPGVGYTDALLENILAIVVGCCGKVKIPVCLDGVAGSSKTTAVMTVGENLNGYKSHHHFWKRYPNVQVRHFQCNHETTSNVLRNTLKELTNRQESLDSKWNATKLPHDHTEGYRELVLLLLDDMNLLNQETDAIKVVHYFADDAKIGIILNANHSPDAAVLNRTLAVFREPCTSTELITLAVEIFRASDPNRELNENQASQMNATVGAQLRHLCQVFHDLLHFPIEGINRDNRGGRCRSSFDILEEMVYNWMTWENQEFTALSDGHFTLLQTFWNNLHELPADPAIQIRVQMIKFWRSFQDITGQRNFLSFLQILCRLHVEQFGFDSIQQLSPTFVIQAIEENFLGTKSYQDFTIVLAQFLVKHHLEARSKRRTAAEVAMSCLLRNTDALNTQSSNIGGIHHRDPFILFLDNTDDGSLMRLLNEHVPKRGTSLHSTDMAHNQRQQRDKLIVAVRAAASAGNLVMLFELDMADTAPFYSLANRDYRESVAGGKPFCTIGDGENSFDTSIHPNFQMIVVIPAKKRAQYYVSFMSRFRVFTLGCEEFLDLSLIDLMLSRTAFEELMYQCYEDLKIFVEKTLNTNLIGANTDQTILSILRKLLTPQKEGWNDIEKIENLSTPFEFMQRIAFMTTNSDNHWGFDCALETICNEAFKDKLPLTENSSEIADNIATVLRNQLEEVESLMSSLINLFKDWVMFVCKVELMKLCKPHIILGNQFSEDDQILKRIYLTQPHFHINIALESSINQASTYNCGRIVIHTVNSVFWRDIQSGDEVPESDRQLLWNSDPNEIEVCQMNSIKKQEDIRQALSAFDESEKKVFLVVVNLNVVTLKDVNFVRSNIDDHIKKGCIYSLVVFGGVYPTLFAGGWEHIFVDCVNEDFQSARTSNWLKACTISSNGVQLINSHVEETVAVQVIRAAVINLDAHSARCGAIVKALYNATDDESDSILTIILRKLEVMLLRDGLKGAKHLLQKLVNETFYNDSQSSSFSAQLCTRVENWISIYILTVLRDWEGNAVLLHLLNDSKNTEVDTIVQLHVKLLSQTVKDPVFADISSTNVSGGSNYRRRHANMNQERYKLQIPGYERICGLFSKQLATRRVTNDEMLETWRNDLPQSFIKVFDSLSTEQFNDVVRRFSENILLSTIQMAIDENEILIVLEYLKTNANTNLRNVETTLASNEALSVELFTIFHTVSQHRVVIEEKIRKLAPFKKMANPLKIDDQLQFFIDCMNRNNLGSILTRCFFDSLLDGRVPIGDWRHHFAYFVKTLDMNRHNISSNDYQILEKCFIVFLCDEIKDIKKIRSLASKLANQDFELAGTGFVWHLLENLDMEMQVILQFMEHRYSSRDKSATTNLDTAVNLENVIRGDWDFIMNNSPALLEHCSKEKLFQLWSLILEEMNHLNISETVFENYLLDSSATEWWKALDDMCDSGVQVEHVIVHWFINKERAKCAMHDDPSKRIEGINLSEINICKETEIRDFVAKVFAIQDMSHKDCKEWHSLPEEFLAHMDLFLAQDEAKRLFKLLWHRGIDGCVQLQSQAALEKFDNLDEEQYPNFAVLKDQIRGFISNERPDQMVVFEFIVDDSHPLNGPYNESLVILKDLCNNLPTANSPEFDQIRLKFRNACLKIFNINSSEHVTPFCGGLASLRLCLMISIHDGLTGWNIPSEHVKLLLGDISREAQLSSKDLTILTRLGTSDFIFEELDIEPGLKLRNAFLPPGNKCLDILRKPIDELWESDQMLAICRIHMINVAALTFASSPSTWHVNTIWNSVDVLRGSFMFGFMLPFPLGAAGYHLDCGSYHSDFSGLREPFNTKDLTRRAAIMLNFGQFALALALGAISLSDVQAKTNGELGTSKDIFSPKEGREAPLRVPSFCWFALISEFASICSNADISVNPASMGLILHQHTLHFWNAQYQGARQSTEPRIFHSFATQFVYEKDFVDAYCLCENKHREILDHRMELTNTGETIQKDLADLDDHLNELEALKKSRILDCMTEIDTIIAGNGEGDENMYHMICSFRKAQKDSVFEICDLAWPMVQLLLWIESHIDRWFTREEIQAMTVDDLIKYIAEEDQSLSLEAKKIFDSGINAYNQFCDKESHVGLGNCGVNASEEHKLNLKHPDSSPQLINIITLPDSPGNHSFIKIVILHIVNVIYNQFVVKVSRESSIAANYIDWGCLTELQIAKCHFDDAIQKVSGNSIREIDVQRVEKHLNNYVKNSLSLMSADILDVKLAPYKFKEEVLIEDLPSPLLQTIRSTSELKSELSQRESKSSDEDHSLERIDEHQLLCRRFHDAFMNMNEQDVLNLSNTIVTLGRIALKQSFGSDCLIGDMIQDVFLADSNYDSSTIATGVQNFLASGLVEGYSGKMFSKNQVDFVLSYKITHLSDILDCIENYIHLRMYSYWDKSDLLKGYVDSHLMLNGLKKLFNEATLRGEQNFADEFIKIMDKHFKSAEERIILNDKPDENPLWVTYPMSDIINYSMGEEDESEDKKVIEAMIEDMFSDLNEGHTLMIWRHALYIKQQLEQLAAAAKADNHQNNNTNERNSNNNTNNNMSNVSNVFSMYDDDGEYGVEESKEFDNNNFSLFSNNSNNHQQNFIQLDIPSHQQQQYHQQEQQQDQYIQPPPQLASDAWICAQCNLKNRKENDKCVICGFNQDFDSNFFAYDSYLADVPTDDIASSLFC